MSLLRWDHVKVTCLGVRRVIGRSAGTLTLEMLFLKSVASLADALQCISLLLEFLELVLEFLLHFLPSLPLCFQLGFKDFNHCLLLMQCLRHKRVELDVHAVPLFEQLLRNYIFTVVAYLLLSNVYWLFFSLLDLNFCDMLAHEYLWLCNLDAFSGWRLTARGWVAPGWGHGGLQSLLAGAFEQE